MTGETEFSKRGPEDIKDELRTKFIRDRMVSGKVAKRRRGEWASGENSVAYGLELYQDGEKSLLRVDPEKIERVKKLFASFTRSAGFTNFAQLARETGIPYDSIEYILSNEIYIGYHCPKRIVDPKRTEYRQDGTIRYQRRNLIPLEERERIKMLERAPISERTFAEAQRLLALRKSMKVKVKQGVDDPFLYRGLIRCAECDRKLITLSYTNKSANNFKAEYYVCQGAHGARTTKATWRIKPGTCRTRRIRREALEPLLDRMIADRLASPKFLEKVIEADAEARQESSEEKLKKLGEEIEELERSIKRTRMLYVRGKLSVEGFDEIDRELQLELRAAKVAFEKTRPNLARITPESWKHIARRLRNWTKLDPKEKRALLAAIAPTFEAAGYPSKRYHETKVRVKGLRLNLSGGTDSAGEIRVDAEEDDPNRVRVGLQVEPSETEGGSL